MRANAARRLFLTAAAVSLGCANIEATNRVLRELQGLQPDLAREFGEPNITLAINNATLTVVFVNSSLAALSTPERSDAARRVAEYVRDHFESYASLQTIAVGFQVRHAVAGVSAARTEVPYTFSTSDLGQRPTRKSAP
jgi:hypothetical protein